VIDSFEHRLLLSIASRIFSGVGVCKRAVNYYLSENTTHSGKNSLAELKSSQAPP